MAGLLALLVQKIQLKRVAGLNEGADKPEFDEVWEASKFKFEDAEGGAGAHGGKQAQGQSSGGGAQK